jgi:hypothetical protein
MKQILVVVALALVLCLTGCSALQLADQAVSLGFQPIPSDVYRLELEPLAAALYQTFGETMKPEERQAVETMLHNMDDQARVGESVNIFPALTAMATPIMFEDGARLVELNLAMHERVLALIGLNRLKAMYLMGEYRDPLLETLYPILANALAPATTRTETGRYPEGVK